MYDLHIHTTCSDGKYSRLELLKKMNDRNFCYACFTDHNYFDEDIDYLNLQYYQQFLTKQNIYLINGVELDVQEYPRLHILGYDIRKPKKLKDILIKKAQENSEICKKIIEKIKHYYEIEIPFIELEQKAFKKNVTKNIIVQWLIDGYAKNVYEAGMLYTSEYSPCYERKSTLKLEETLSLISDCDGIPVMAHPSSLKLNDEELLKFIIYLRELGIKGIEVFNADKTNNTQLMYYLKIAQQLDLLTTSGSDFHREEETKILGVNNNYSERFMKLVKERRK